jgi:hypothetical protein
MNVPLQPRSKPFPPHGTVRPGLILGVLVFVGGSLAWLQLGEQLPAWALALVHPLASGGHALAACVGLTLLLEVIISRNYRQALHGEAPPGVGWPVVESQALARRDAESWQEQQDLRWKIFLAVAALPFLPGVIVSFWSVLNNPEPQNGPKLAMALPVIVAGLETVALIWTTFGLEVRWAALFQKWLERIPPQTPPEAQPVPPQPPRPEPRSLPEAADTEQPPTATLVKESNNGANEPPNPQEPAITLPTQPPPVQPTRSAPDLD